MFIIPIPPTSAVRTFGIVECVVKKSPKIVYQSACQVCVVNVYFKTRNKISAVHAQRIFVRGVDISVAFLYSDHHAHHGIVRGTKPDYRIADSTYAYRFPEGIFSQEKCFRKSIVNQADGNSSIHVLCCEGPSVGHHLVVFLKICLVLSGYGYIVTDIVIPYDFCIYAYRRCDSLDIVNFLDLFQVVFQRNASCSKRCFGRT